MKLSKYSSCVPISGHTLVYDAFTDKYVVIKHHELDRMSLQAMASREQTLYHHLCEAGVFIAEDTDEVSLLRGRIAAAENNSHEYLLDINPTLDCNFNCWYCYENHIKGSMMSPETVSHVKQLMNIILSRPTIQVLHLGFFGGEPLLGFQQVVKPLIEHAASQCDSLSKHLHVHFTTNAGVLDTEMIEYLSNFNCGMQITLDGGKERHDKVRFSKGGKGSYDRILHNITELLKREVSVILRVNYDTQNIDTVEALIEDVIAIPEKVRTHLLIDFQRVWQDREHSTDATESKAMMIRKFCEKKGIRVGKNFMLRDVRHTCYADKVNHALINYDGNVFACTARDFTSDSAIGSLSPEGIIRYHKGMMDIRRTAKLSKDVCCDCRIAPICGGGCSQKAVEGLSQEGCHQGYSESDKDKVILNTFQYKIMGEYPENTD